MCQKNFPSEISWLLDDAIAESGRYIRLKGSKCHKATLAFSRRGLCRLIHYYYAKVGGTNTSYMRMWHEATAVRGGNEVSSCLLRVLFWICQKTHLNIWRDNSAGQNKYRIVLFVLIYLVTKCHYLSITMNFFSCMACDRDFGVIIANEIFGAF